MPRYVDIDKIKILSKYKDADGEDFLFSLADIRKAIQQVEADVVDGCKIKTVEKFCRFCDHYEIDRWCNVTHEMCSDFHTCERFE